MLLVGEPLRRLVALSVSDSEGEVRPGHSELDIHLGCWLWLERWEPGYARAHRLQKGRHEEVFDRRKIHEGVGHGLKPGELVLAETRQRFKMPDNVYGVLTLRSWAAKSGLEQSASMVLKPGWEGALILELRNNLRHHELLVEPNDAIGQIQFFHIIDAPWSEVALSTAFRYCGVA